MKLPVLVISAHSRCNCRCTMCDIWKTTESVRFTADDLRRQLDDIQALGVEWVVFTGGEPLLNADLFPMAATLRELGIRVTVLSSGLLLGRFAREIVASVDDVIVSLDGPRSVHDAIRGVPGAFDRLEAGVRALREIATEFPIAARCTIQRANHHSLVDTAAAARTLGLDSISYLAVDVSTEAFNHRAGAFSVLGASHLLNEPEICELEREVQTLVADPLFEMVAENPAKLARIVDYFRAMSRGKEPVAPMCNAPWVSAVVQHDGAVRPCFFHAPIGNLKETSLADAVNGDAAVAFRRNLDVASNPICRRCVCSRHRAAA
jgi:MoaA/NifB/PqqE/SkfB family radical SAM enzyme